MVEKKVVRKKALTAPVANMSAHGVKKHSPSEHCNLNMWIKG